MFKPCTILLALIAVLTIAGCVSQSQFLDNKQAMAVQTALNRARFDMQCPEATATVLSREVIQPAYQGPRVMGVQRAEYTIGVSGCGQRATSVVICPDGGEGCFAADPGRPRGQ
jgi:hypothetical protein